MTIMSKGRDFILALAALCICIWTQPAGAYTGANEIVFIDAAVQDAQVLQDGLPPGVESVQLKADSDGVLQIGEFLEQKRSFSAIHVISHAGPGRVFLGTGMLSADTLEKYRKPLQAIASSLGRNGEILLYGCDVAKGRSGVNFVEALTKATGTKVAASVDRTGPEWLGGNGALEFSTGPIKSRVLAGFDRYRHTLAAITYTFDSDVQGWTGGMWHTAFPGQLFQATGDAEINFYPPSARYLQTMQVHSYLSTGQNFHMYVMYQGEVKYSATINTSTSWGSHTINQNFDRIRFVNDIGGGNGWIYPGIDNVATLDAAGNSEPTVTGSSSTSITTAQTATPFSTLTVADADLDNVSLTITYTAANGTLTGAGLGGSAGNYTMSSAAAATIQSQLRALLFTPTDRQVPLGNSVATTFTITPNDGHVSGTANTGCQVTATATYPRIIIANPDDNLYTYITSVTIGTINNTSTYTSTDNQAAYSDYSVQSTTLWRNSTYNISVTLGGSDVTGQTIAAFFDWNNNGVFTDSGETVTILSHASGGATGGTTGGPYTASVTVPAGATLGAIRMRVVTDWNRDPLPDGNIDYGEAEDYTINIVNGPAATTGSATGVTATGATLNGTVNDNGVAVTSIYFDYGTAVPAYGGTRTGTPAALSAGAGSTAITGAITGLTCETTYHFRVNAVHSGGAAYGGDLTFTTGACNTAPAIAVNTGLTLNQADGQTTITTAMLQATDPEQVASDLTFTISTATTKGTLKKSGTALGAAGTFTQADINGGLITYTPSGTQNGADGFTFTVSDGAGGSTGTTAFSITIDTGAAPAVTAFAATTPANSLSIPITAFTASDDTGVTGYLITTSGTPPAAGDPGWSGTAPATFAVPSAGSYTLYPWARDAAGNVSALYASPAPVTIQTVLHAAPGGMTSGFCESWANACELRYALANAGNGQEIWVKAGSYKPTADNTDRGATFQLRAGVAVYGGFAGTETARSQRDWTTNLTVLSGDIDNNDSQTPVITDIASIAGNATNSYHVVTGANNATLDGVSITGGNANGTDPNDRGGGMFNNGSSPALANCTFRGNAAGFLGGGMCNFANSSPTVNNCTFSGNSVANYGAGMFNSGSNPTLVNCVFSNNTAGYYGAGMANWSLSSPALTDCTFSGNSATHQGGGMYNNSSNPTITTCRFNDNSARAGGGMYNFANSSPTLVNCTFSGNSATTDAGGGILNDTSSPTLTGCTLSGNSAAGRGGGMFNAYNNPALNNCTFSGNTAPSGGAMYNMGASPALANCTFSGNAASSSGAGMYNFYGSHPAIRNSILWGDGSEEIYNDIAGTPLSSDATAADSVIQDGCPENSTCTNVIAADPLLASLGDYGGVARTMALLPGSSAIDAGNNATCAATDQRGMSRPQNGACDMGAFESQGFTLAKTGGDNQSAVISTSFVAPLALTVTAGNAAEPVNGGAITFVPPASGPGLDPATPFTLTVSGGAVSRSVAANGTIGTYAVPAASAGATGVSFSLTNVAQPDTAIDSQPNDPSNGIAVTFSFHGTGGIPPLAFQCSIDGGAFSACTSPRTYSGLGDGSRTFWVRTRDVVGNTDATPAGYTWTVDTVPPPVPIAAAATNVVDTGFSANWEGVADASGYYLDVAVDDAFTSFVTGFSGRNVGNFLTATVSGLAPGSTYYYRVRAYDSVANVSTNSGTISQTTLPGPVTRVVVEPGVAGTVYSAVDGGGIWKSTDGGDTWNAASNQPANLRVKGLVIHPSSHSTLFAATYGGGVYKSMDGGDNWNACANTNLTNLNADTLAIDQSGTLYAGTEGGIFKSADCGTWTTVNGGLTVDAATPPVTIAIDETTPATLYAGLDGGGVFKSENGGGTWTAAATQPGNARIKALAIKAGDSTKIFAATYGGGVFNSTDSGVTWNPCADQPTNLNAVSLTIDATGRLYAGTEAGVFVSNDNCASWNALNTGLPL